MFKYDPLMASVPRGIRFHGLDRPQHDDYFYWNGRLLIYEFPNDKARYVLGVDPAQGLGADRSVVQVLRVGTVERPDIQVAEFASDRHGPVDLAEIAAAIGRMYGGVEDEALAVVELNSAGGGNTCQSDMRFKWGYGNLYVRKREVQLDAGYAPQFGWTSTPAKRRQLVYRGIQAFNSGDLVVNSPHTIEEMRDFQPEMSDAIAQAASGKKDDRVMGLFMAYLGAHEDEWMSGENVSRQRRVLTATRQARSNEQVVEETPIRRDWQNTPVTFEDMMASWDDILDRVEDYE